MAFYSFDYLMAEMERKQAELAKRPTLDPALNFAFGLNELIEKMYEECEKLELICEELRMSSSRSPGDPGYPGGEADILERCNKLMEKRETLVTEFFATKGIIREQQEDNNV